MVTEALGAAPKRQFEIIEPDKFVRITMVSLQIHQKSAGRLLGPCRIRGDRQEFERLRGPDEAEHDLRPRRARPELQSDDYKGEEVPGVQLNPGMKYMLVLTVKADKSETAQIYFETK